MHNPKNSYTFAAENQGNGHHTDQGEMVEWSITTVLKTVVLRGTGGSNPSLSAKNVKWEPYGFPFFCVITRVLGGQKGIGELCSKMINSKKF